jgi:nicotinamidase-related amidase
VKIAVNSWGKPRFETRSDNTALLVIDLQNDFVAPGAPYACAGAPELVGAVNDVIRACRGQAIPVIFTAVMHRPDGSDLGAVRHLHPLTAEGAALREGTPGVELYPDLDVQPGDVVIGKRRYSAFFGTDLDILLRDRGVEVVIIAGVATNVCCDSTARDAFFRGYKVIFLADGTATIPLQSEWGSFSAEDVQRYTLATTAAFFGEVATVAEVLSRIRAATTEPARLA